MRIVPAVWLVATILAGALPAQAADVLVGVGGVGGWPLGNVSGGAASDLLDFGYGLEARAVYAFADYYGVGLGAGVLIQDVRAPFAAPLTGPPIRSKASLTTLPAWVLFQASTRSEGTLDVHGEAGVGLASYSLRFDNMPNSDPGTQNAFAYRLGAGVTLALAEEWDGVLGVGFQHAITSDGGIWRSGDDPTLLLVSIGARFRR